MKTIDYTAASYALAAAVGAARRQSGMTSVRPRASRAGRTTEQIRKEAYRSRALVASLSDSGDGFISIEADAPSWVESFMRVGMGCENCIFERAANPLHAAGTATWLVLASESQAANIVGYEFLSEREGACFYRKVATEQ